MEDASPEPAETDIDALLEGLDAPASDDAAGDTPSPPDESTEESTSAPTEAREPSFGPRRLRRDRFAFFLGVLLMGVGLFALLLGSVLHDAFRVPWVGTAYGVFGPLNVEFAAVGAVLLIPGLIALRIGLRGGVIPAERASEG